MTFWVSCVHGWVELRYGPRGPRRVCEFCKAVQVHTPSGWRLDRTSENSRPASIADQVVHKLRSLGVETFTIAFRDPDDSGTEFWSGGEAMWKIGALQAAPRRELEMLHAPEDDDEEAAP